MEGKINLSRDSRGIISMRIEDVKSGIDFIEIELSSENFTAALFGDDYYPCTFNPNKIAFIGKKCIKEEVIFEIETSQSRKEALQKVLELDGTDGWEYSTSFGTLIDSFFSDGDKHYARTIRKKYV